MKESLLKKDTQKPKIGEIYHVNDGKFLIVREYSENDEIVFYSFNSKNGWAVLQEQWGWKEFPLRKLTPLEEELL